MSEGEVCYSGYLVQLLHQYGLEEFFAEKLSEASASALRVVNVYVEGDCRLFQEFMQRVRERLASMNRATLESIFEAFMVEAERCSVRLMWSEINIEVTDPGSGSWFRVIARGAPLDILLAVKSVCVRRLTMKG